MLSDFGGLGSYVQKKTKENFSLHFLSQSDKKPKPIVTFSLAFSYVWHQPLVFASSSDWFITLSVPVVIGYNNYFGFGFTPCNEILLYKPKFMYSQRTSQQ